MCDVSPFPDMRGTPEPPEVGWRDKDVLHVQQNWQSCPCAPVACRCSCSLASANKLMCCLTVVRVLQPVVTPEGAATCFYRPQGVFAARRG